MSFEERMEFLTHSIESHDRQIGELTEKVDRVADKVDRVANTVERLTGAVEKLVDVTNQDATSIRALARIAEIHERRLTNLEGGPA